MSVASPVCGVAGGGGVVAVLGVNLVRCEHGPDKRWEMLICVYCIISSGHAAVMGAAQ